MARLDDLTKGALVRGDWTARAVKVVDVERRGLNEPGALDPVCCLGTKDVAAYRGPQVRAAIGSQRWT